MGTVCSVQESTALILSFFPSFLPLAFSVPLFSPIHFYSWPSFFAGVHEEEDQILSWEDHYLADDDGTRGPVQSHQSLHSSLPQSPTPTAGPDAEDKMPPKMRKRWIHQSAQALRATAGVEEDGGGVLGKMDVDVEGNGEGDGDVELSGMFYFIYLFHFIYGAYN